MAINAYVYFNGNCREAVEFYAKAFGAEAPRIMTFGDTPPNPAYPLPEQAKKLVLHAELKIADSRVMFSDTFPGNPYTQGNNINITVMGDNAEDIKTWFNNLKEGGTVTMELQKTFWSDCYGMLTDKFGIGWQLSTESH
jgi:PhnB protein